MTPTARPILDALDGICGRVLDLDGEIPQKYLIPWRGEKGEALAVIAPSNETEIKKVIEAAKTYDFNIIAQGARTSVVGGAVPISNNELNVVLSTERIRDVLEFNKLERKIVVSAGFHLSEINEFLEPHGFEVPINVTSDPMAGAMAATNIAGARVLRYGDCRKLCSGVEVILADDNISTYSTIAKPRKDNSSMDFTSVFVGSFGKCGVITKVELEVVPKIKETATAFLYVNNTDLSELLNRLFVYEDLLLACELISANSLATLGVKQKVFQEVSDVVLIEIGKNTIDAETEIVNIVNELINEHLIEDAKFVPAQESWNLRHQISEAVQASGQLVGCDISVTRDKFSLLRTQCNDAIKNIDTDFQVCDFGHLGDGGVHMNIVIPFEKKITDEAKANIRRTISQIAVDLGGSFSAEHGLGLLNAHLYDELTDKTIRYLSQQFKLQCDPDQIFGLKELKL